MVNSRIGDRDIWLDALRALAVIGVIGSHAKLPPISISPLISLPMKIWQQGGWVGVDIFFVLSGFLVSGLLFKELNAKKKVSIRRFLIRRCFKIYPPFWLVIIGIVCARAALNSPLNWNNVLGEILFLQNYLGRLSGPHWTLAVEEHFYLLLALWFWLQTRGGYMSNDKITKKFRLLPVIFLATACACIAFRIIAFSENDYSRKVFMTHVRVDALMFGAVLSWLWHLKGFKSIRIKHSTRLWLFAFGLLLLLPPFAIEEGKREWLFHIFCFNCFYLGAGLILIAGYQSTFHPKYFGGLAKMGVYSYGIYLCHEPLQRYLILRFIDPESSNYMWALYFATYSIGSVTAGIALTRLVELPSLRLRDKIFPSNAV